MRCRAFLAVSRWRQAARVDASPEPGLVKNMFDRIAGSYDRLNDLMTAGRHHRWRERAVALAAVRPGDAVLDVCCGTGDMAFALKRAVGSAGRVVAVDISPSMLEVAREKCGRNQLYVEFGLADVLALPFPSETFAACTVAFGIRNVPDIAAAFAEMRRVCAPGGRVVCLELTRPEKAIVRQVYGFWMGEIVPRLGRLAAREDFAYRYLPASVERFPDPDTLSLLMRQAGLKEVGYELLAGGALAIHFGVT